MTGHFVKTSVPTSRVQLSEAILLYRSEADETSAYATTHPVDLDETGAPVIGAGSPLTHERVRAWAQLLRPEPPLSYIPETTIARNADSMVWWVPAAIRDAYFNLDQQHAKNMKTLGAKCVRPLPYPPLLLAATKNHLYVYALRANRRPTPDTILHRSPILNVYTNATLCWGSIPHPDLDAPDAQGQFEQALFESWSTHPNDKEENAVRFPGGTPALWDHLASTGATKFPTKVLKPRLLSASVKGSRNRPMTIANLLLHLAKA